MTTKTRQDTSADIERWARWIVTELADSPRELSLVADVVEALARRARSRRHV